MSLLEADRPQAGAVRSTSACHCGSGLEGRLCCSLDPAKAARTSMDPEFGALLAQMAQAYDDGELTLAEHFAHAALRLAPGHRDALGGLYNVCKDTGRIKAAETLVRRMATLHPDDAMTRANAALFFHAQGAMHEAAPHARVLLRLAPDAHPAQATMGLVFGGLSQPVNAEHHLRRSLELGGPADLETLGALASAVRAQGRFEEARELYAQALEVAGSEAGEVLIAWADMEEAAARLDAADALLARAAAIAPDDGRIAVGRATVLRRRKDFTGALAVLERIPSGAGQRPFEALAHKERGQNLDALGRHDEAFAAFAAFKQRIGEVTGHAYAADAAGHQASALKAFFTVGRTPLLPRASVRPDGPQPIFVVGFPRSGTTLVEQTLATHAAISAGDELPIVAQLTERLGGLLSSQGAYPQALSELWTGDRAGMIDTLRDHYLNEAARLGAVRPDARWFTDKMPLNETHLGLIHLLFPRSPIIHLVRHPMDVVLSVFSNGLSHGFHCASSLDSAARHFALTADLVEHYRAVLPMRYLAVRYEDIVSNQENEVRRLFDFIDEPYDPGSLAFHENRRPARTASYAQVTEKLYDRSRFRFRNYRRHLAQVEPILRPWIERLGYGQVS
ncbi:tetratricopeptide repeat-containing sulfotransferase family protein [Caulobacter endophyticus]|uniref:tetratricopeptide repeat-containing sulfotransferase family protein n=1 Tax=Caulobacter endophyticus TaxID=2172652 RepID=UPI00241003FF|nr:sulfotransferase [Caulobacter endophyticus]MDG2527254.1 sulfotransferase [Caulobacter endophyticus]